MNRKMLTAGWIMLALSAFLMTFMFEALVPRYYRYKKNQALVRAYKDVEALDLSDLDDEAYDILTAYEGENLFFIISDKQRNHIYTTQTADFKNQSQDLESLESWREKYSSDPEVFYQPANGLRLAKLRGIVTQGTVEYYVYIKERGSSISDYNETVSPFLSLLGVLSVLVTGAGLWICYRMFAVQVKREANISKDQQVKQKLRSERMERLQKEFVTRMTHELKTPLAVISS